MCPSDRLLSPLTQGLDLSRRVYHISLYKIDWVTSHNPRQGIVAVQSATTREIQHHLAAVLKRVEAGEEFEVRCRQRPVARIVPVRRAEAETSADWSSHAADIARIFGGRIVGGKPMQDIVAEGRGEF